MFQNLHPTHSVCELFGIGIATVRTARWYAFELVSALGITQTNKETKLACLGELMAD